MLNALRYFSAFSPDFYILCEILGMSIYLVENVYDATMMCISLWIVNFVIIYKKPFDFQYLNFLNFQYLQV